MMQGQIPHWRGFLSFNTALLGSGTAILGAKLRMTQATPGTYFGTGGLGTGMVDTKTGSFNNNPALQGIDYDTDWTTQDAFPVINVGQYNWFDAYLSTSAAQTNISNTDHTQFRVYFNQGIAGNKYEGWYSGETNSSSPSTPPHLIVQYQ